TLQVFSSKLISVLFLSSHFTQSLAQPQNRDRLLATFGSASALTAEREASCQERPSEVFREILEIYQADMSNTGKELYEFGPFRLDSSKRVLLRDNHPVPLQLKAFETLLVLVRNSEQVVLKDELMKEVWPDTFVEESNLAQNIFVLRKTLGDTVGDHRYIVTIPGRGYSFASKVRTICEEESLIVESRSRTRVVIDEEDSPEKQRPIGGSADWFSALQHWFWQRQQAATGISGAHRISLTKIRLCSPTSPIPPAIPCLTAP